jgi:hypothetical protein
MLVGRERGPRLLIFVSEPSATQEPDENLVSSPLLSVRCWESKVELLVKREPVKVDCPNERLPIRTGGRNASDVREVRKDVGNDWDNEPRTMRDK